MTGDDDAFRAREAIRAALYAAHGDSSSLVTRPVLRDRPDSVTTREVPPRTGLRTAHLLAGAAVRIREQHAAWAREDGLTWPEIGDALGIEVGGPGITEAERRHLTGRAAFNLIAVSVAGGPPYVTWYCQCGARITDTGPEYWPGEAEQGHKPGCARFAALRRAWDEQWEEDGEGED